MALYQKYNSTVIVGEAVISETQVNPFHMFNCPLFHG